jgi:membrane protein implicated in regulation of membrane protease activity
MNIKQWPDEKLASTRDEIDAWCLAHSKATWSGRIALLTAWMGAFAISTGIVFFFFDGITAMSFVLIALGSVACFVWYKTEQQRKLNNNFLKEIKEEIARRAKKTEKVKKAEKVEKVEQKEEAESVKEAEES